MENVLGFPRVLVSKKADGTRECVEEFAKAHPRGRYVVSISGHWTTCIDGVIYDTWDCSKESVLSYYEIIRFERTPVEKKYCFIVKHEQSIDDCSLFLSPPDTLFLRRAPMPRSVRSSLPDIRARRNLYGREQAVSLGRARQYNDS